MDLKNIVERLKLYKRDRIIFIIVFIIMIIVLTLAGVLTYIERNNNNTNKNIWSNLKLLKWGLVE